MIGEWVEKVNRDWGNAQACVGRARGLGMRIHTMWRRSKSVMSREDIGFDRRIEY